MNKIVDDWSRRPDEENGMTDEHAWIWREMIDAITWPKTGRVLDIGCNQGGFLRLLHDTVGLEAGVGVDLARNAIRIADDAKENRPLVYLVSSTLTDAGRDFNVAVSHEVIYLISDLVDHAKQVRSVLKPGGAYYAVTCCHADMPLWPTWREHIQTFSNIPVPNHSIGDIVSAFRSEGFEVAINRFLANAFVPLESPNDYFPSDCDRLDVYAKWKVMFRFTTPT